MDTWQQVVEALAPFGAVQLNDTMIKVNMLVLHEGVERNQAVFVSREEMPPLLDFLQIKAAFSLSGEADLQGLMNAFGGLVIGSIGFTPSGGQGGGILALEANIPLSCFALTDPTNFHIYISTFARAADTIERAIFGLDSDRF